MTKKLFIFTLSFVLANVHAEAQGLTTDMPRQTIAVNTVPKKWLQVETGVGIKTNKKSFERITNYALPGFLFRYGICNGIEARVLTGIVYERYHFWNTTQNRKSGMWGTGPVEVGGKLKIWDEKKNRPSVSLSAHYRFNNNLRLSYDTMNGGNFRFSFQNRFSENFQLDYSAGMDWVSWLSQERYIYTLSPVLHFNEKWSGYLEASGIIRNKYCTIHFTRAGARFSPTENYAFDFIAGKAWNRKNSYLLDVFPNGEVALQFAWRFNTSSEK